MSEYAYAHTGGTFGYLLCCVCGEILRKDYRSRHASMKPPRFCPNCGERISKRRKLSYGELTVLMMMQVERANAHAERYFENRFGGYVGREEYQRVPEPTFEQMQVLRKLSGTNKVTEKQREALETVIRRWEDR